MKRLVMLACCMLLITVLAAQPFVASAQDTNAEEDYIPLIFGDNVFSLLYPSKWTFDSEYMTNGSFVFASDPSILTRPTDQPYAPGEITVAFNLLFAGHPLASDAELEAILTQFLQYIRTGSDGQTLTNFDPSLVSLMLPMVGVPPVARAMYSNPGLGDGVIYLWTISDRLLGIVNVNTATGEIALQEPDVMTLIQSVQFNSTIEDLMMAVQQQGGGS